MTRQIASIYLWIAPLLSILVGGLRNLAGTEALIAGYAVFVALTAAAIWKLGAAKEGRVREHPAFVPGVLLAAGPLTLLLGASVTGEPTAARPGDYLLNTTAILLGSLILVAGFVVLFARLWEAGQRLLPVLGLAGLLAGTALWLANLVFRYAVVASGAAGLQAAVEDRAWVAYEYLPGLRGETVRRRGTHAVVPCGPTCSSSRSCCWLILLPARSEERWCGPDGLGGSVGTSSWR